MTQTFPVNPENGTIFEIRTGVLYQYDAMVKSWIKIATNSIPVPLANHMKDGLMSATDLQKLNRLMIPPPRSTITGNDCYTPFERGVVALVAGDDLINIEGNVSIQNVDEYGDHINKDVPFQIHQHTYGYDFNLDLNNLVNELIARGQLKMIGPTGPRGDKGRIGDAGIDAVLSGPQGEKGFRGLAPPCPTTIQTEVVQTRIKQGLKRALTNARIIIDEDNHKRYQLEFDRQIVGREGASAAQFNVRLQSSSWVLAVTNIAGIPQQVYYLDIEPIVEAIHNKFLTEVERLKLGYEEIVRFWIQTMSDLFDEQKAALCCALEFCQSKTNNDQLRQHMESVAAAALPDARIFVEPRGYPGQAYLSGTALWPRIGQPDVCAGGHEWFPYKQTGENDTELIVDPMIHLAVGNRVVVDLTAGRYSAVIHSFDVEIGGQHYADLCLSYIHEGKSKVANFLNKGAYSKLAHAKSAYEGLSLEFEHTGGEIAAYYNLLPNANVSGNISIKIHKIAELLIPEIVQATQTVKIDSAEKIISRDTCIISATYLSECAQAWVSGIAQGFVMEIHGQDYIIVKSLGDIPCAEKFKRFAGLAIAWPTFDMANYVGLPNQGEINFAFDPALCALVGMKLSRDEFVNGKGIGADRAQNFSIVLFPDKP